MKTAAIVIVVFALVSCLEGKPATADAADIQRAESEVTALDDSHPSSSGEHILLLLRELENELAEKIGQLRKKRELICTITFSRFCI